MNYTMTCYTAFASQNKGVEIRKYDAGIQSSQILTPSLIFINTAFLGRCLKGDKSGGRAQNNEYGAEICYNTAFAVQVHNLIDTFLVI